MAPGCPDGGDAVAGGGVAHQVVLGAVQRPPRAQVHLTDPEPTSPRDQWPMTNDANCPKVPHLTG